MKPFLFSLPDPQKRELQRLAKKQDRSIAELLRRAVDLFIEQQRKSMQQKEGEA